MTKQRTGSAKTITGFDMPRAPVIDVITQSDLRAMLELTMTLERLGNNIARRIDLGAKVQYGALVIEDVYPLEVEGIIFPEAGHPVNVSTGNFRAGRTLVDHRKGATQIMGKLTKRIKSAA